MIKKEFFNTIYFGYKKTQQKYHIVHVKCVNFIRSVLISRQSVEVAFALPARKFRNCLYIFNGYTENIFNFSIQTIGIYCGRLAYKSISIS
jgi:hypothetical protein